MSHIPGKRAFINLPRAATLPDGTTKQNGHGVAQKKSFLSIVCHDEDREPVGFLEFFHYKQKLAPESFVKGGERFVKQQQPVAGCHGTHQGHSLALPTTQVGHGAMEQIADSDRFHQSFHEFSMAAVIDAPHLCPEEDVFMNRQMREQRQVLGYIGNTAGFDR